MYVVEINTGEEIS